MNIEDPTKPKKAVVLLSGGLDSSVLCSYLLFEDIQVHALIVDYGQRHRRELEAADAVAAFLKIPTTHAKIDPVIFAGSGSSQVSGSGVDVPEGHYAAETMKATIVPNRNMILLALAAGVAESRNADCVAYAAHAGDHFIYPDCRPEFYESCAETIHKATDGRVMLYAPFGTITKTDIARRGQLLRAPLELTYSCYVGLERHCGRCGTCTERIEAFKDAGVSDPTSYETRA
jgi:7-cyano-7-deazaguanine synthase